MSGDAWFEDPSFWSEMRGVIFSAGRVERGALEVEKLAELLAASRVRSASGGPVFREGVVLDMPCGVGRHALPIAGAGARVTAVDLTEAFVRDVAAAGAGLSLEARRGDMRSVALPPKHFDVALCMYSSLGYSESRADDEATLQNFFGALRPGGALVLDTMALEILLRTYEAVRFREADGWVIEERAHIHDAFRRVETTYTLRRDGELRRQTFRLCLYSAGELCSMLERVGFASVRVYGGLDGSAYDQDAARCLILAFKPDEDA